MLFVGTENAGYLAVSSLESIFGIHETALKARSERVEVLAANLANADTPNYKARDLDFAAVFKGEQEKGLGLTKTSGQHLDQPAGIAADALLKYRIPFQPSLDGNTVEVPIEQAKFAENAVRYQASLAFVNEELRHMKLALTGRDG